MNRPILFTQTDCEDSAAEGQQVRAWLIQQDIPFTERNVTGDLEAAQALYETGVFATPLLLVDNVKVLGFRARELTQVLDIAQRSVA